MNRRGSGILLHLTSLPSPFGIGDMGSGAHGLVDFLHAAGQVYWQILPLNPTNSFHDHSPYLGPSAFACNPLLISPEGLVQAGFLLEDETPTPPDLSAESVDYGAVATCKEGVLQSAFARFRRQTAPEGYETFCRNHAYWLDDFALFEVLNHHYHGKVWSEWPEALRNREAGALLEARKRFAEPIERARFFQYNFFEQWFALKKRCNEKGIRIIGDIPIYLDYHSADVWVHSKLFKLNGEKRPYAVAGVPPDYFSETGQLWGNPLYDWGALRESGYDWWIRRIEHNLTLFDIVRIDHFRGLVACWEVPAEEKTAVNGTWADAPAMDFLGELSRRIPDLPIIAEDLGIITPEVREVMDRFKLPGMKPLLFAFTEDLPRNPYIPHNLVENCVAYTGTHDNNTARGWFTREAGPEERRRLFEYLGRDVSEEDIAWTLIRLIMMSVAETVIFPVQDLLGLGEEARMNRPATKTGNWRWRLKAESLTPGLAARLLEMSRIYGRA